MNIILIISICLLVIVTIILIWGGVTHWKFIPKKKEYFDEKFKFDENDLKDFLDNIYTDRYKSNNGGMKSPDLFTFYFTLKKIQPDIVIESGVWNGLSTKLIRQTLGENIIIICLDPREIPINGFKDQNKNTIYFTGKNFKDFKDLDLQKYNNKKILAFFDDHQNQAQRLLQSNNKNIKHLFFNDNYPVNGGSHFTIEHLLKGDIRDFSPDGQLSYGGNTLPQIDLSKKDDIINLIKIYIIFPNIFSSVKRLDEPGKFNTKSYFKKYNSEYKIFYEDRQAYSWNTYVGLY